MSAEIFEVLAVMVGVAAFFIIAGCSWELGRQLAGGKR